MLKKKFLPTLKFTIIEMLIVVFVLGLLAGILLPAMLRSRKQAKKIKCLSNLKQLAVVTRLYVDDSEYYPDAYRTNGSDTYYWCFRYDGTNVSFPDGLLGSYLQGYEVFRCPSFLEGYTFLDSTYGPSSGYGMNIEYLGGSPVAEADILDSSPAKNTEIMNPSETMLYIDSSVLSGVNLTESFYFWPRYNSSSGGEQTARTHYRHLGYAIVSYCDGHADDDSRPDAISDVTNNIGWPERELCDRQ